jgi:hypothetical protein
MFARRTPRRTVLRLGGLAALGALLPERIAHARPLALADAQHLATGDVVRVPMDLDLAQGHYFGGVSYAVVRATVADVTAPLADPSTYTSIIPMTIESRVLDRNDRDMEVLMRQGARSANAAYVLTIRRESLGLFRFWLDPSKPHDIADLWGFFRVQPWGTEASLLTYAALVRLDFGVMKLLFSEAIRKVALGTPGVVRAYVHAHRGAMPPG